MTLGLQLPEPIDAGGIDRRLAALRDRQDALLRWRKTVRHQRSGLLARPEWPRTAGRIAQLADIDATLQDLDAALIRVEARLAAWAWVWEDQQALVADRRLRDLQSRT